MDDYYCAVLQRYLGEIARPPEERHRIYEVARSAVERAFSAPDKRVDRANELSKLNSAILKIEARFAAANPEALLTQETDRPREPDEMSTPPSPGAPEARPDQADETFKAQARPEGFPAVQAAPDAPPAAFAENVQGAVSRPSEANEHSSAVEEHPHASLFASELAPDPVYIVDERAPAEDRLIDRMKVVALLVTLGIGAYFYFSHSRLPAPDLLRKSGTAAEPMLVINHDTAPVRYDGEQGTLAWVEGRDPPSIALRDARKPVLRAEGSAGKRGPQVMLVVLPSDFAPFPRGDMIELRLEGGTPGIAALVRVKMTLQDGTSIEPDGVIVRAGAGSFDLVFGQDDVARDVGRALLRSTRQMIFTLTREDNSTRELEIELPPVFARQFGGAMP